jgi:EAL domain-containing protein (putative c-di-GMP-specific phosphodiesterase class I)
MPSEFIPAAEEAGFMPTIGEAVLRKACHDAAAWEAAGAPPVRLSVNVAYQQIEQPEFIDVVRRILSDTPGRSGPLRLEITESAVLKDLDLLRRVSRKLAEAGVSLSIDDFGTGNTTLRYLTEFKISELKIDQSFIRDLFVQPESAAIASSVIDLGHSLGLSVLAEGVETEEQLLFLRERQCDEYQGFVHSSPMPAREIPDLLLQTNSRAVVTAELNRK